MLLPPELCVGCVLFLSFKMYKYCYHHSEKEKKEDKQLGSLCLFVVLP